MNATKAVYNSIVRLEYLRDQLKAERDRLGTSEAIRLDRSIDSLEDAITIIWAKAGGTVIWS